VQVPEPGAARRPERSALPKDVRPEDMAALLDAFSDPSEKVALADVRTPAVRPQPDETMESVDDLLGELGEPEVEAAPASLSAEPEMASLLESVESKALETAPELELEEPVGDVAELLAEEEPVAEGVADAIADVPELELPLSLEEAAPPALRPEPPPSSVDDDLLAGVLTLETDAEEPRTLPPMEIPGLKELLKAARTGAPEKPVSRSGTKFQAAAPKRNVPAEGGLDLLGLAEDAFAAGQRSAPAPDAARPAEAFTEGAYGHYRLLERVAVGGMAEVFRAKRSGVEGFEKIVAVKRILPHLSDNKEFVEMFIDEAKMVAGLTHPNIVQISDLGKIDKTYYIAMEYVHGKDLRTILRHARERGLRLPLDLSVLVVSRVCAALEYAHRARDDQGRAMRIVHRDISPQNILISFEGDVKLTDFGIAKAATKATVSDAGALRGKLLYMSPEQAWGKPMDRRSDVFSLGIVFYEMVTDQKPFLGTSEMSILETVRECKISSPSAFNPRIPEKIEKVILKALERDPDERYQDAAEMSRDLERVLRERQPPTSVELARYMELLFDRSGHPAEDEGPRLEGSERGIEIELDTDVPATEKTGPGTKPPDQKSIQKLLKRFGIK
jgi:serine/threonine protein kinase